MADTKWTPAQAAAIADRGGALLLSAAAGSGKTAVLTERAVGLILDPVRPVEADRLLIVTFTNAAAAELRARIGNRLLEEVKKDPTNARLRRQRILLQRASICTVDAFCMDLLHRHFAQLDIPSEFQPADPGQAKAMWDAALAETMEEMVTKPDFCDFADLYGRGRSDAAAGEAIGQLYEFLQVLPDPDQCLEVYLESWRKPNSFVGSKGFTETLQAVAEKCNKTIQSLRASLELSKQDMAAEMEDARTTKKTAAAQEKAAQKAMDKFIWLQEDLDAGIAFYTKAEALAQAQDWDGLNEMLTPYREENVVRPGGRSTRKRLYGENKETVKLAGDLAGEACDDMLDWIPASLEEIEADRVRALPMLEALAQAQRVFAAHYYAKKIEKKMLDFSDMEQLALRLLRRPADIHDADGKILPIDKAMAAMQNPDGCRTPLCEQISDSYDAVMVDEYQDTNALQDALYNCLAKPSGDNLFFVGDLKQSIYRFRQAEPHIFLQRQQSYAPLTGGARVRPTGQGSAASLALDANFRSASAVIDGINFIFTQVMRQDLGDVVYGDGQRLVCGAKSEYTGQVEAAVLQAQSPEAEAEWVAARIERLVKEEKAQVRCKDGTRPIQYEDCCILVSTRSNFAAYIKALQDKNIPSYAATADDLLEAAQVRPLIALLRVIDNPARNIELAAAMRSELFGFTDDDLLQLRATRKKCSLYGALVAVVQGEENDAFAEKCRTFYTQLDTLRSLSRSMPVDRLLEEVFARTGYLAAVGAGEEGARRREEVRRFAAWASEAGASGLGSLIYVIEATQNAKGLQSATSGKSKPGCVSIMTIHGSKGLQFPAVFVVDTAHRFNMDDIKHPVLLHRDYGFGLALRGKGGLYPTVQKMQIRRSIEAETRSEQMRLLYVALTRAQDMLFMTIPLESPEKAIEKAALRLCAGEGEEYLHHASRFSDWLLAALLQHPDAGVLRVPSEANGTEIAAMVPLQPANSPMRIIWEEAPEPEAQDDAERTGAPTMEPDMEQVEKIRAGFAWQYPEQEQINIPVKVSVTSLVHQDDDIVLERPAFMSAGGLTAAEMGTALHAYLEHADFAALAQAQKVGAEALTQAIAEERDRQMAMHLMTQDTANALDMSKVHTFVQGEAFRKICEAETVYREFDFITGVPASRLPDGPADSDATVMVQGIADLLLVYPDHLELLDYKTDRSKNPQQLRKAYHQQLELYADAIEKRFAPKKVTYKGIYSFALGQLVEI